MHKGGIFFWDLKSAICLLQRRSKKFLPDCDAVFAQEALFLGLSNIQGVFGKQFTKLKSGAGLQVLEAVFLWPFVSSVLIGLGQIEQPQDLYVCKRLEGNNPISDPIWARPCWETHFHCCWRCSQVCLGCRSVGPAPVSHVYQEKRNLRSGEPSHVFNNHQFLGEYWFQTRKCIALLKLFTYVHEKPTNDCMQHEHY